MVRGMRRSLFVGLLGRLLVGFAAAGLLCFWLTYVWLDVIFGLVIAAAIALWCLQLFLRTIRPLEIAAQRAEEDALEDKEDKQH